MKNHLRKWERERERKCENKIKIKVAKIVQRKKIIKKQKQREKKEVMCFLECFDTGVTHKQNNNRRMYPKQTQV